jgi:hypothetical protein
MASGSCGPAVAVGDQAWPDDTARQGMAAMSPIQTHLKVGQSPNVPCGM